MGGSLFIALGMLFIVANKLEYQKSIIPMSVHSVFGCVALLIIAAQVISGQEKLAQLDNGNKRVRRWHGESGLLLWDLLCVTMILGLMSFLSVSFASVLVYLTVVAVWMAVHAQLLSRSIIHKYDSSNAIDDTPVAGFGTNNSNLGLVRNDSFNNMDIEAVTCSLDGTCESSGLIGNTTYSSKTADDHEPHSSHDYDN
jgi:hypothetical protein